MPLTPLGQHLRRGALAGLVAGAVTAAFHLLVTGPVLERALALEGAGSGPISRTTQKYVGGPAGQLLFGLAVGVLFALAYRVLPGDASPWRRAAGLAAGAAVVVVLVPQGKYPANPPGVGDAETITTRTSSFLLTYALGLLVVPLAVAGLRELRRRGVPEHVRQPSVLAVAVLAVAAGWALLPARPNAGTLPAELLWDFRVRALAGLLLFFAVLGTVFGVLEERAHQRGQDRQDRTAPAT